MYNNYQKLLNIKYHNYYLEIIIILLIIFGIIFAFKYKVYEKLNVIGIYHDKSIIIKCPIEDSDTIIKADKLFINDRFVNYEINNISDILVEDYINYQLISISTNNQYLENEAIHLSFYYKKEVLFKKIIKIIKEV